MYAKQYNSCKLFELIDSNNSDIINSQSWISILGEIAKNKSSAYVLNRKENNFLMLSDNHVCKFRWWILMKASTTSRLYRIIDFSQEMSKNWSSFLPSLNSSRIYSFIHTVVLNNLFTYWHYIRLLAFPFKIQSALEKKEITIGLICKLYREFYSQNPLIIILYLLNKRSTFNNLCLSNGKFYVITSVFCSLLFSIKMLHKDIK